LPEEVRSISRIVSVHAGDNVSLAIDEEGKAFQWGKFSFQTFSKKSNLGTPTSLFSSNVFILSISTGSETVMALDIYGKLYAWGRGDYGGLGTGNTKN
jgi:alpha-tubulin suppressor-like RCC1 family protein